jgi:acetylornithine deacetylase/succinyl-diaminopimelate desuccinylase-like protein
LMLSSEARELAEGTGHRVARQLAPSPPPHPPGGPGGPPPARPGGRPGAAGPGGGAPAPDLLEALIFRPTANIDGLEAGYTGPGGMTIIPDRARAVLDVRLVPDLEPESAARAVRERLDEAGFGFVDVDMLDSYPWARSDPDSPVAAAMRSSYERMGRRALPYPMAPWCAPFYVFDRILGMPWASGGLGHSGGAHAPDEFATVAGLREHIVGVAEFCLAFAELSPVRAGQREAGA